MRVTTIQISRESGMRSMIGEEETLIFVRIIGTKSIGRENNGRVVVVGETETEAEGNFD